MHIDAQAESDMISLSHVQYHFAAFSVGQVSAFAWIG